MSNEQKLVDIVFAVGLRIQSDPSRFSSLDETAIWIANCLKACGFETKPMGSSHGVLITED